MDTLSNMRVFARVVDAGTFTAAANHLNITTAQVSRAIADLESHLQTRLLNRTTRRLALTEAGSRYLQRCVTILASIDEAEQEASETRVHVTGTLRVHSLTTFGQRYLVPAIARFRERHPAVSVDLTLSQRVPHLLDDGFDSAVILTHALPDSGMIAQQLGQFEPILCASPLYLRQHGTPQTPHDLLRHDCMPLQSPDFPVEQWVFSQKGRSRDAVAIDVRSSRFRVNSAEAIAHAVRVGMGIGLLPSYAAIDGLRDGTLIRVLAAYALPTFQVHALYPSRQYLDAKIRTWIDNLSAYLPDEMRKDQLVLDALNLNGEASDDAG